MDQKQLDEVQESTSKKKKAENKKVMDDLSEEKTLKGDKVKPEESKEKLDAVNGIVNNENAKPQKVENDFNWMMMRTKINPAFSGKFCQRFC